MFELPADFHVLALVGLILVAGQVGGWLARLIGMPRVTGYLLVGLVLGPSVLGVVDDARTGELDVLVDVALAVIAFLIAGSLRLRHLRPLGRSIFTVTIGETLGAFVVTVAVTAVVLPVAVDFDTGSGFWSTALPVALVVGALAVASAPAAILAIVHENRSDGPVTRTLLGVVAIDDAIAILLFALMLSAAEGLSGHGGFEVGEAVILPVARIVMSLAIGVGAGLLMTFSTRLFTGRETLLAATFGMVLLVAGVAESLDGSLLLADMAFGVVVANAVRHQERIFKSVEEIEELVFGAFFVLAGARLELSALTTAGLLGLALLLGRFAGKLAGAAGGAWVAGATSETRRYLGLALLPQAGVAVGLVLRAEGPVIDPGVFDVVLAGVLASVLVNELITPFAVRYALKRSGEIAANIETTD